MGVISYMYLHSILGSYAFVVYRIYSNKTHVNKIILSGHALG